MVVDCRYHSDKSLTKLYFRFCDGCFCGVVTKMGGHKFYCAITSTTTSPECIVRP